MADLRRTPLYDVQKDRGGRFVDFAGWEMAVQFAGVVAEHTAVRERVGLFDVSHMGELLVQGPQAEAAVQHVVTNNVAKLKDGQALYTVMCLESGGIVDDLIVYREGLDRYFICINASRREVDFQHFLKTTADFDCTVSDVSDRWAQIAVQGPKAYELLASLSEATIADMSPFSWVDATVAGVENVRIARTGYTGEDGVELYVASADAPTVWRALEREGETHGLQVCGLGARDTLRLEMRFALYGNDIDADHNPYEAGLGWTVKLKKGDFVGRAALAEVKAQGPRRKLVGFKMLGRGIPRHGYTIECRGEDVGVVTSGTHSPSLGEPIGLAYVPAELSEVGAKIDVAIRGKSIPAEVVKTPFYQRGN